MYTNYEQCNFVSCIKGFYTFGVGILYFSFGTMLEDEFQDTASSDTNKYNLRIVSHLNVFFFNVEELLLFSGGWGGGVIISG